MLRDNITWFLNTCKQLKLCKMKANGVSQLLQQYFFFKRDSTMRNFKDRRMTKAVTHRAALCKMEANGVSQLLQQYFFFKRDSTMRNFKDRRMTKAVTHRAAHCRITRRALAVKLWARSFVVAAKKSEMVGNWTWPFSVCYTAQLLRQTVKKQKSKICGLSILGCSLLVFFDWLIHGAPVAGEKTAIKSNWKKGS